MNTAHGAIGVFAFFFLLPAGFLLAEEENPGRVASFSRVIAATPEAREILEKIDANVYADSVRSRARLLVINARGQKRVLEMINWGVGDQKAFSEYTAPIKERGTKMLKVEKNLWTYSPSTDRVIHIAGHLLRQSVMGSDLSYEDSMEDVKMGDRYLATLEGEETFEGRSVWVLRLEANSDAIAYPKRKLWVDKEKFLPLREERFAKSGKLLKTLTIQEIKRIHDRWYPTNLLFKDELKSGKGTEFIMDEIEFNPKMPENIFSKQMLKR